MIIYLHWSKEKLDLDNPHFYLHCVDDPVHHKHWVDAEGTPNPSIVSLPGDTLCLSYPGGYKSWWRRDWDEAPDWVKELYSREKPRITESLLRLEEWQSNHPEATPHTMHILKA